MLNKCLNSKPLLSFQQGAKRLFVKNDFYGHNEPGSSKRVYYPVKQEKLNVAQLAKRMKVDEDDTEARAKEVREMLQSIMGLTYKVSCRIYCRFLKWVSPVLRTVSAILDVDSWLTPDSIILPDCLRLTFHDLQLD